MAGLCHSDNIAMTPYNALAGGRLSKRPGESSKRLRQDSYAKQKYSGYAQQDECILEHVANLADSRGVTMTEIFLAWLLTKVTSLVTGATRRSHVDGMVRATELMLTEDEIIYLEECYVPHPLVGVMAQNTADTEKKNHVWSIGNQKIK